MPLSRRPRKKGGKSQRDYNRAGEKVAGKIASRRGSRGKSEAAAAGKKTRRHCARSRARENVDCWPMQRGMNTFHYARAKDRCPAFGAQKAILAIGLRSNVARRFLYLPPLPVRSSLASSFARLPSADDIWATDRNVVR